MRTYEPMAGDDISSTCQELERLATEHAEPVQAEFNGLTIIAEPGMKAADIEHGWREESDRRRAEYVASPEYRQRQQELARKSAEDKAALTASLADAPPMVVANQAAWDSFVANNRDGYGGRIIRYAEEWARLMQVRIDAGETVESCAEELSHIADDDGLTGFMHGAAVSVLAKTWRHGEELRCWHNVATQICDEGDRANEQGGVLNPATLSIG